MLLSWVVIFLVVAFVAGYFGFSGVSQESAWIAKILFFIFLILCLVSLMRDAGMIDLPLFRFSKV